MIEELSCAEPDPTEPEGLLALAFLVANPFRFPAGSSLAKLLRDHDINVTEITGWQTRTRPGAFHPIGIVLHHTAGATVGEEPSLQTVINGRPDLRGPLAQFHVARSGRLNLVSAGRANHAGPGFPKVLDEVRRGVLITRTAAERNLPDGPNGGNAWFSGFEVQGPPFTDAQVETCVRGCVALFRGHGWPIGNLYRIVTHAILTQRKHDPDFDPVAANVRARVRGREGDWFEMATEADLERVIRRLLEFGPGFGDAT